MDLEQNGNMVFRTGTDNMPAEQAGMSAPAGDTDLWEKSSSAIETIEPTVLPLIK